MPVSPLSLKLFGCPSGALTAASTCTGGYHPGALANSTTYVSTLPITNTSDNGIAKIDYRINDKNSINGMLYKAYYTGIGEDFPEVNTVWANTNIEAGWQLTGDWIYTATSALVNEFRVGYNRFNFDYLPPMTPAPSPMARATPSIRASRVTVDFPSSTFTGLALIGWPDGRPTGTNPNPYLEFQDNVSYLRGKHAFKVGVDFAHIEADSFNHDTRGRIDFLGGNAFAGSTAIGRLFRRTSVFRISTDRHPERSS